ncbi:prefoldin subunit 4, putative [Plasmodium chabaudi chabaudi]|uniref:Prefoldin subunit 4 n=2 Tax=Plasmodium chabaudi TaxID=5825 RepID=A0A077TJH4_PLACU|nr:prefoldin subunit 4, putative [Plasmodium chabaudi chabaudi]SCM01974.1 prefoldin subunit 4, putative [Plasmodium chabaudi adami]SCL98652.1 prefoldin subunit 4, putative [Plasmodium chabaudi chabaudi]SCL99553.1 prefoldin subunit 4, putative [Plasmodium chabaudi chabaudi]SCM06784.1 prefoldin subunit 4, putative [Plasmodium chabaudi adami]VTZ67305.1 prefoldin subunit 4, putative [Plasmodium chabaudi chabaudi]|eukprot:XP_745370.1 prefoldin subunit, putative [Plasmodium chabaudi chabaudi]
MADVKDSKYDLGLDMTIDDQKKIGKFTNLHYKQSLYQQKIKLMKEKISNIDSAIDEVSLVFDPNDVMLGIGDCFFSFDTEYVEESLEKSKNEEKMNLNKLECEYKNITDEKQKLKTELYAKFGNRIDLN